MPGVVMCSAPIGRTAGHGDRVGLLACIPAGPECEMASRILEPDLKGEILKTVVIEVDFIMTIGIETE